MTWPFEEPDPPPPELVAAAEQLAAMLPGGWVVPGVNGTVYVEYRTPLGYVGVEVTAAPGPVGPNGVRVSAGAGNLVWIPTGG